MSIVKDISKLNIPCEPVSSIQEGDEIAAKLFYELNNSKTGVGLAANQIGILKRVLVMNVKEPLFLINPKIVEKSDEMFLSPEGCLSFPNKQVRVNRHVSVVVEADNIEGKLMFTAEKGKDLDNLECACVQHEIDHLDGITMFDKEVIFTPRIIENKFGRNEIVKITNGTITQTLKWKKAESLIKQGKWSLSGVLE